MTFEREKIAGITIVWIEVPGELDEEDKDFVRNIILQKAKEEAWSDSQ